MLYSTRGGGVCVEGCILSSTRVQGPAVYGAAPAFFIFFTAAPTEDHILYARTGQGGAEGDPVAVSSAIFGSNTGAGLTLQRYSCASVAGGISRHCCANTGSLARPYPLVISANSKSNNWWRRRGTPRRHGTPW